MYITNYYIKYEKNHKSLHFDGEEWKGKQQQIVENKFKYCHDTYRGFSLFKKYRRRIKLCGKVMFVHYMMIITII